MPWCHGHASLCILLPAYQTRAYQTRGGIEAALLQTRGGIKAHQVRRRSFPVSNARQAICEEATKCRQIVSVLRPPGESEEAREKMAKRLKSRKCLKTARKSKVAVDWNTLTDVQKFNRVFAVFKSVTAGGADGGVRGVNGTVNGVSTKLIMDLLRVKGNVVCDVGAADGKFMVCAWLAGAQRVFGVEFAENIGYKMVLAAVVEKLKQEYNIEFNLDWIGGDIADVRSLCILSLSF